MELIIFFFTLGFSSVLLKLLSNKMGWKVSWLLPIVLGFVIAVIATVWISMENDQETAKASTPPVSTAQEPSVAEPKKTVAAAASEPGSSEDLTEKEAYEFAQDLFKKIEDDEKFVKDAFELKEENTLFKYVVTDWHNFANTPHKFTPRAKAESGNTYFPSSEVMTPYYVCDSAFRDLNIYANAMMLVVDKDTASGRKILRQEQSDFEKSKELCKKRLQMSYEQALADYEKE